MGSAVRESHKAVDFREGSQHIHSHQFQSSDGREKIKRNLWMLGDVIIVNTNYDDMDIRSDFAHHEVHQFVLKR